MLCNGSAADIHSDTDCMFFYILQMVKHLGVVTKGLDKAMASMNLEEVEKIMSKFETTFEDLDVRESVSVPDIFISAATSCQHL